MMKYALVPLVMISVVMTAAPNHGAEVDGQEIGAQQDGDAQPPHAWGADPLTHQMREELDALQYSVDQYLEARHTEEVAVAAYLEAVDAERRAVEEASRRAAAMLRRGTGTPSPDDPAAWEALARCETAGRWDMRGSTYSGGLGIYNGTWRAFGGSEFAPDAGLASREQQITVGRRIHARYGWTAWGCARTLGWS